MPATASPARRGAERASDPVPVGFWTESSESGGLAAGWDRRDRRLQAARAGMVRILQRP
jgi:hypothetical protein